MRPVAVLGMVLLLAAASPQGAAAGPAGAQYDSTHVYVPPEEFDRFVASFMATFGGTAAKKVVATLTPVPSRTMSQLVLTPAGTLSVFGYETPLPYPFGSERGGYLVDDLDAAVKSARACGAALVVAPFADPIGRDALVQWPGGVVTQLYWHYKAPNYPALQTEPESRIYLPPDSADGFIRAFSCFAQGKIESDDPEAPGIEIGRPNDTFRRVRIRSAFGPIEVLATDGHLPFPYGRELTGYEVANLEIALAKAEASGAITFIEPYTSGDRRSAVVQFRGGYIAEIHAPAR